MILLNHGVFTFSDDAKESYDNMIEIVSNAENFLKKNKVWKKFSKAQSKPNLLDLAKIRNIVSRISMDPCIALLNVSSEAVGFSKLKKF